jgi:hypothetical protein
MVRISDRVFLERLQYARFEVEEIRMDAERDQQASHHTIWLATKPS